MDAGERVKRLAAFLSRQPRDVVQGGWSVLLRKVLMLADVVLAVPLVLLARLLRPLILIRVGGLPSTAIGHLALDMELLLCRRDAGLYGHRTIDLFCCALPVCNQQLKRMWERTVHVSRFVRAAERVNRWLPGGRQHRIPFDISPSDTHGFLAQSHPHLSFTSEEQRRGWDALRSLGIPEGQPYVCLLARDLGYSAGRPRSMSSHERYRVSDIRTYLPAAQELVRRGSVVVRMGAAASEPFTSSEARIIDYASTARDDFLDIFLCAHCHFYCGDGGGLFNVPLIFRRPIATVNYVHLAFMTSWNPYDLFIPKTLWLRSEKRWLTLREILESEIGRFKYDAQYAEHGIEVVDNTPDEITALAIEMEERLCGTWQTTEEEEELQRRFWTIYRETNALYRDATVQTRRRIGAEFLRQHRELLDWEGAPLRVTC